MILLLLLAVLLAAPAWAIEEFTVVNLQSQAIADGAGSVAPVVHYGTVGLDVSITNTATVTFQGRSTGGQSFHDVRCINTATGTVSTTATSSGNYQCPIAGLMELKTPISDCASCIVSVSGRMTTATIAGLASITAAGADGAVLDGVNSAIKATVKDYTNSNPLTTIVVDTNGDPASLGGGTQYTEDAAAAADPVGTQTICRRRDALSTETTLDGDNTAANCTGKGELYVKHIDAVPVTDNGGSLTVDGTVAISGSVTVTDGAGALNVIVDSSALPTGAATAANQDGIIKDGTGDTTQANVSGGRLQVDGSGVTQPISGTVTVTDGAGALNVIVDSSALPTGAATAANQDGIIKDGTGDTTQANVSSGRLHVDGSGVTQPVSGTITIGTFPDNEPINVAQINGVAVTMGNGASGTGVQRVTIASDSTGQVAVASLPNEGTQTAANSISVTLASDLAGGATTIPTSAAAGLIVRQPIACTSYAPISQTGDTAVITATASQYVYVCSIVLVAGAAETVSIWEGTGTACGTGSAAIFGSTTEANGLALAANGGFSAVAPTPFFRTASTNVDLCIRQVGTNQISGMISYLKAP